MIWGIPIAYIRHNLPMHYEKDIEGCIEHRGAKDAECAYETYCEHSDCMASDNVKSAEQAHGNALDEYIAAVVEDSWKKGYDYAMSLVEESEKTGLKSA